MTIDATSEPGSRGSLLPGPRRLEEVRVHVGEQPVRVPAEQAAELAAQAGDLRADAHPLALVAVELAGERLGRHALRVQREQHHDLAAPPRQHDPVARDGGLHRVAPQRPQAQRARPPGRDPRLHELGAVAEGLALQALAADLAPAAALRRLQPPRERAGRVTGEDVAGAIDERARRRRATCDALEEPGP